MERIQAAIAKARAAREGDRLGGRGAQRGPFGPMPDITAAWRALEVFEPEARQMERNRIFEAAKGPEGAAFDVLRTRTLKLMKANGWRRVAVTSPTAACGKSTVILNLGFSLTRPADVSAIIIEADMRRPSLQKKLGLKKKLSMADVLAGTGAFSDNAVRLGKNRLAMATNHGSLTNPSDLLQGPQVADVLAGIERDYEPTVMLFDMPPLLVNDDTIAFLQHVDCVLLVAAADHTSIEEIDSCERELAEHTNVLGVTLNKCRYSGRKYGYDYYYS